MQHLKNYELIIFDCDGTLADSEMAHNKVMVERLHSLGLTHYTIELCMEKYMGRAISDITASVEKEYSVIFPSNELEISQTRFLELLPDHLRLDNTTKPLLDKLEKACYKMAVGSNGTRNNVLNTIKAANFESYFPEDRIFTYEMVKKPKPSPDLYLHVCDVFKTHPQNAIVIEDTVAGAMAGIEANIDTVGYIGLSHRENQAERLKQIGCKQIIHSMIELETLIYNKVAA